MTIEFPGPRELPELRSLWQEAFGDPQALLDDFFRTGYAPQNSFCVLEEGRVQSALYWFDCNRQDRKLAYIYGVATGKSARGKGYASRLLAHTHRHLKALGYAGILLVPAGQSLRKFYAQAGYGPGPRVTEELFTKGPAPVPLRTLSCHDYCALRDRFLPPDSVRPQEPFFRYLGTQYAFYQGEDFLLCGSSGEEGFLSQEFLGDRARIPGILTALGIDRGRFRSPGEGNDFAMYLPLDPCCSLPPAYLGPPLD